MFLLTDISISINGNLTCYVDIMVVNRVVDSILAPHVTHMDVVCSVCVESEVTLYCAVVVCSSCDWTPLPARYQRRSRLGLHLSTLYQSVPVHRCQTPATHLRP